MKKYISVLHEYAERGYRLLSRSYFPDTNIWQRYGFAIFLVAIFFLLKVTLFITLRKDTPFLFSLFIVIISAWFGGLGPGLLATFLSGLLTYYFFLDPRLAFFGTDDIPNLFFTIIFFLEGIFISVLSESRRRSDKQKNEFISLVSHELKNPLTTIKGYAEMIPKLTENRNLKVREFATRISHQVSQVIWMVNDLLDITKIETGRLTYQDQSFKAMELIEEVISDQQVTTKTHKLSLSGKTNKIISGDKYRIGQVITNLINNAIKYSPRADKVDVKIVNNNSGVTISVTDRGFGIDKKELRKLFQPFFRAKNSSVITGTGIGLFISSQIVKRHKGKLRVSSKPGKGSTFYLELLARNKPA